MAEQELRRAIALVLKAAVDHKIGSAECARAVDEAARLHADVIQTLTAIETAYDKLHSDYIVLADRLASAESDRERLDWLDQAATVVKLNDGCVEELHYVYGPIDLEAEVVDASNIRDAIDAAMNGLTLAEWRAATNPITSETAADTAKDVSV